jgi:hypothetical protein
MSVSRVDIRTFDWPASIMLWARSAGFTYDMVPPMAGWSGELSPTLVTRDFTPTSAVLRARKVLLTHLPVPA